MQAKNQKKAVFWYDELNKAGTIKPLELILRPAKTDSQKEIKLPAKNR